MGFVPAECGCGKKLSGYFMQDVRDPAFPQGNREAGELIPTQHPGMRGD
jgi:hypothetical protein